MLFLKNDNCDIIKIYSSLSKNNKGKSIMKKIFSNNYILFFKKAISISLTFLILFNANTYAFTDIEFVPPTTLEGIQAEIQNDIEDSIKESNTETKTPQEFLADLVQHLEKASQDDTNNQSGTIMATAYDFESSEQQNIHPPRNSEQYHKLSKEEYTLLYNEHIEREYKDYANKIESKARGAFNAFDKEAEAAIQEQQHILNANYPFLRFAMPSSEEMLNKKAVTDPLNIHFKAHAPSFTRTELENMAQQEAILERLNNGIAQQREEYVQEVNTWKKESYAALNEEKNKLLADIDNAYQNYSQEYNTKLREFYISLVDEIVKISNKPMIWNQKRISFPYYSF